MSTGTDLVYNGVTLSNVQTLEFSQTPERDPSGTDIYFNRLKIRVRTLLNAQLIGASIGVTVLDGASGSDAVAMIAQQLRAALLVDRGYLTYSIAGTPLVQSDPSIDCNNGPHPTSVEVVKVNNQTIRLDFSVEAALVECPDFTASPGQATPQPVINNRWQCTDDIDDLWRTTRTWSGVLRIANNSQISIQTLRQMVMPPLVAGFRRESINIVGETNALVLAYTIVDKEMIGPAPPWPAARMQVSHVESLGAGAVGAANPIMCIGQANVRLEGARGVDKRAMINRCMQICEGKLQVDNGFIMQVLELAVAEHISHDTNAIEVHMRVNHTITPGSETQAIISGMLLGTMGQPLVIPDMDGQPASYDPNVAFSLGPNGTATLATLFMCALQSPCDTDSDAHSMPQQGTGGSSSPADYPPVTDNTEPPYQSFIYTDGPVSSYFNTPPPLSDQQTNGAYQSYQIDSEIRRKTNRAVMPISSGYASPGTATSPTIKVVALSGTTCIRVVRMHGERMGACPTFVQDVDFVDNNGIQNFIIDAQFTPVCRNLSADGQTYFYSMSVEYEFALERPPTITEPFSVGSLPWDGSSSPYQNMIPNDVVLIPPDDSTNGIA